jgi:hypothetical protein
VGGGPANTDPNNPEFPWDVHMRVIYDWGIFFTNRTAEEVEKNEFTGVKSSSHCTGVLYSINTILSESKCLEAGIRKARKGVSFEFMCFTIRQK